MRERVEKMSVLGWNKSLTGGRTIDSEDVVELWRIGIPVVENNDSLEESIPSVSAPVTEGELYNGQIWGYDGTEPRKALNHHQYGLKLLSVIPSIVTNLKLLD